MTGRVVKMENDYIVYWFHEQDRGGKETDKFFIDNKITKTPTVLVFNLGKVVARHEGLVESVTILKGMKTRKSQDSGWEWFKLW